MSWFHYYYSLPKLTRMPIASNPNIIRRLEGKVALITGGASGLGEYTAKVFTKHGAKVLIADIQDTLANKVCQNLGTSSSSFIHCDVTDEKDMENAVNTTVSRYGKLDIMFNNAGILGSGNSKILENDHSDFERVVRVNLVGSFLGVKHAAKVMIPNRSGSIIMHGSISSVVGGAASHAYVSSKHAVVGLTRNAAVDLGRYGIRVNCLSPYLVASSPMGKDHIGRNYGGGANANVYDYLDGALLEPKDVAEAALFLASDESKYVSGHDLVIDGGFTCVNRGLSMFHDEKVRSAEGN